MEVKRRGHGNDVRLLRPLRDPRRVVPDREDAARLHAGVARAAGTRIKVGRADELRTRPTGRAPSRALRHSAFELPSLLGLVPTINTFFMQPPPILAPRGLALLDAHEPGLALLDAALVQATEVVPGALGDTQLGEGPIREGRRDGLPEALR